MLFGAAFLFCVMCFRVLWLLPAVLTRPAVRQEALLSLAAGTVAGAAGGLGYSLLGAPLRRVPRIGRDLAGVVTIGSYVGAIAVAASFTDAPMLVPDDRGTWAVAGLVVLFFGIVVGRMWLDEPQHPDAPTSRQA